ncbi:PorP/SprF family type IX secretion system membrane protein [Pseudopedobacter sp.]|uniref:PorP/SprF family type IX secretion system membrane protein n=1 Tax=Pseudopedobacter sp. TaxID=1936787 RepID=UPI00334281E5
MRTNKIKLTIFLLISLCSVSKAQVDPHFSQYYAYPLLLNPALTGVVDGDYRIAINARQQWGSLNNAYYTGAASFDMAPTKNLSFGATVMNQKAGEIDFNYLTALASAAYRIKLGSEGNQILNFGLQAGIINKSFDASKATYGNQYDPGTGYNNGIPNYENVASHSSFSPDINAGLMYFDGTPNRKVNIFAGASIAHLTRPVDKFLGNKERIPMRYTVHGGARLKVSEFIGITPNALYMSQGNAHETSAGAYANFMVNSDTDILFGGNYRFESTAIAFLGLQVKNMVLGLSYDMNTASVKNISRANGGLEISLSFTSRKGIVGPNFFCPRL